MKHALRLIDMLALKTLAVGVSLVQGTTNAGAQIGSDTEGTHSSQFPYFIEDANISSQLKLAADIYRLAARTNFAAPGFALIRQTKITSSIAQRKSLLDLKENLSQIHQATIGQSLGWFSISRFDQRNTSKPHRDAAPAQSLLLLGYEPSKVTSDLWIADYSACAYQLGLSPMQFLEEFNPMYAKGMNHLAPYMMPLVEFDPSAYHILVLNNSCAQLNRKESNWQGVLHSAQTYNITGGPRVINSTAVMTLGTGEVDAVSAAGVDEFLISDRLSEATY